MLNTSNTSLSFSDDEIAEDTQTLTQKIPRVLHLNPSFRSSLSYSDVCLFLHNLALDRHIKNYKVAPSQFEPLTINQRSSITTSGISYLWKRFGKLLQIHRWNINKLDINWQIQRSLWAAAPLNCSQIFSDIFKKKFLKNFPKLNSLQIDMDGLGVLENHGIGLLGDNVVRYFPNLQNISLTFNVDLQKEENYSFKKSGHIAVHSLPNLNSLDITFKRRSSINDKELENFLVQAGMFLPCLKHFGIALDSLEEIREKGFDHIRSLLSNHRNSLKSFKLIVLDCPKISVNTLENFLPIISSSLNKLTDFSFGFNGITDKGLEIIDSILKEHFGSLKKLELQLPRCLITPEGLSKFGVSIPEKSNSLQQFKLDFTSSEMSDTYLRIIGDHILLKLHHLKILDLNFFGCDRISDSGLQVLGTGVLPKLANLTELSLSFCSNSNTSEKGFKVLASKIAAYLTNLHKLDLNFPGWAKITDNVLEEATSNIAGYLVNLQYLKLNFSLKITDTGCENSALKIAKGSFRLIDLTLNFSESPRRSVKCEQKVQELLQAIPILKIEL